MERNRIGMLIVFLFLVFNSCSYVARMYTLPNEIDYMASSESGCVYSDIQLSASDKRYNLLTKYFQSVFPYRYENYSITIDIDNMREEHQDTMLYMYINECSIVLPSGSIIDLLDNNNIIINYSYTGRDFKIRAPPKTLRNIQPQYTEDGKKILFLESLENGSMDGVWIRFNAKIPSSVQTLRIEYTLTVVWENKGEVRIRKKLLFKKESHTIYPFTV